VSISLYLHFITEKKRVEHRPHLLVGFSHIGFSSLYPLCGWCVICLASLILVSIISIFACVNLVTLNMNLSKALHNNRLQKLVSYVVTNCANGISMTIYRALGG
jgi:hypothetical protein